ncbi:MAG: aminoacyl-tRNA hydrolase [Chloroflexia bacterium]
MAEIKLVLGLGNTGKQYERTRHNVGFLVAHELERRLDAPSPQFEHNAAVSRASYKGRRVLLARPLTMMNLSGLAASSLLRFYKFDPSELLVVYDELDLAFGRIRLRPGGSAGGHNGVRSVITSLGTQEFARLRVGVGRPTRGDPIRYVLGRWTAEEAESLGAVIGRAADAAEAVLGQGLVEAMNSFNGE